MPWLDDLLAQLQGGAQPPMMAAPASPFPDMPKPPDEAAMAAAAREAAGQRMIRANQRRIDPFGMPDQNSAGIQLALDQAPAGTGFPGAMPAGAPDSSPFGMVPPSLAMAKSMTASAPKADPEPPMPGAVPMPRPRPVPTDLSAAARPAPEGETPLGAPAPLPAPMGIAAPQAAEPSFLSRLSEGAKGMAPALLAAGSALQGDNSVAANMLKQREALAMQAEQQNVTARALLARGAPPAEVQAAIRNPDLLKALIGKYFETKQPQVVGGRVIREQPDGSIKVLADYSEDKKKNPVVKEFTNPDGSVIQKQWNTETEKWDSIPGFEKPGPKDKDRRLSVSDISKLSEEGGKLSQINTFQSTFKPEYGGWKSNKIGDLANEAARNLPESIVGKSAAASAAWWQDYDRYKNVVRHELFGSALTKLEGDAFMRADIGPGMTPEQIARNLATQKRVVEGAMRRKGKGLIGSTYDKGAIAAAYGVAPEFFDQEDAPASNRGGTVDVGGQKIQWSVN